MKINLGSGRKIMKGYVNLDQFKLKGVNVVHDLNKFPYPFKPNSVDEIYASHILEHVDHYEKTMAECYRILKKGGIFHIRVPHFSSAGAHGEFHRRFFRWSFMTSERFFVRSSPESDMYNKYEIVKKTLNFRTPYFFMKVINFWMLPPIYEETFLRNLFPTHEIEVIARKK